MRVSYITPVGFTVNCLHNFFFFLQKLKISALKNTEGGKYGNANKRRSDLKSKLTVVSGLAVHIINTLPPALKKGGKGGKSSNLFKLLSLKHLNNLALNLRNLLYYFGSDNKRVKLYSAFSSFLSASLLMEIAAYFAGT